MLFGASKKSDDLPLILILLAGGLIIRLFWVDRLIGGPGVFQASGEATLVAQALAEGRGFADAYAPGFGPTAHFSPAVPIVPALLLWLFGPGSSASNVALLAWCLTQVTLAWLLAARLFRLLGSHRSAILLGFGLLCLVPVFIEQETMDFRWWEGALALCLGLLHLNLIIQLDERRDAPGRALWIAGALLGFTAFLSPPVGLASGACWAWFALRRLDWIQRGKLAGGTALLLALLVVPWAIRNQQQLGSPVALRSNTGLEIAIANHAEALSDRPPGEVIIERGRNIHPYLSERARAALRAAGGEVAYSRMLGAEARRWILANPGGFARLSLRHLAQFYFPRPWEMEYSAWKDFRPWRAHIMSLVNLAGLLALGFGLWKRRRGYAYLAIYLAVVAVPYMVVQPMPRYTYLIFPLLVFLASDGAVRLVGARHRHG